MITLARFIMKGPGQAALVTATMAILGLVFMPISWFSSAAIALVVLVNGAAAGARVIAFAVIGAALLTTVVFGRPELALVFIMLMWLPAWLPAVVLRHTVSLALALLLIAGLALLASVLFYLAMPGFEQAYVDVVKGIIAQLQQQSQMQFEASDIERVTELAITLLPGLVISSMMLGIMASLMLARWWQAMLYNPGGFGEEFQSLRLGKSTAGVAIGLMLIATMQPSDLMIALVMVVFSLYLLQGTSLLHALVNGMKLNTFWLFAVYALMLLVPHVVVMIVLAGLLDAFVDFRRRLIPA